jgi:hypothetical protein
VVSGADTQWLLYANKFGEVLTVPARAATDTEAAAPLEPAGGAKLVLAHCSTIITSLLTSPRFIVTTDREEKVRACASCRPHVDAAARCVRR